MKNELLELLAYIDLDLEEVEVEEEVALSKLEKPYKSLLKQIDRITEKIDAEIEKLYPDLGLLELLRNKYFDLLYQRYEYEKQYLIGSETIATIEFEELKEE